MGPLICPLDQQSYCRIKGFKVVQLVVRNMSLQMCLVDLNSTSITSNRPNLIREIAIVRYISPIL